MIIAKVIVDVPASLINRAFDYRIPDKFETIIKIGMRVIVPFGPRKIMGFVVEITDQSEHSDKLKPILEILDIIPALTPELLDVGKWLAEETLSLYISAYQAMLPQVLKSKYKKELVRLTGERLSDPLEGLFNERDHVDYEEIEARNIPYLLVQKAIEAGDIEIKYLVKSKITKKTITMIKKYDETQLFEEVIESLSKQAVKQRQVLEYFIDNPEPIDQATLLGLIDTNRSTIKALLDKKLLQTYALEVMRNPYDDTDFPETTAMHLTDEQAAALEPIQASLENQAHDVFLLYGVTGSGKTEVYLQAIEDVIKAGKEAIVLVPEIALTPQMVTRFKGRFRNKVAVLHSALSSGEKYDEWRRIHQKEVQVVVGARSAIFAPFENLGIIIIDEEHELTYKQEDQPRYHARDVAIYRAKHHHCPVVLGSATPTLESYARAKKDVYKLLELTERTNKRDMPEVEIVDMTKELHAGNRTMFSRILKEKIEGCIERKEQIVLLLNRRGYSTFVMCRDCGFVKECPHCDIALTYHKNSDQLKCHYCSYEEQMPTNCPECKSDTIRFFGTGTQKVEESLTKLIPEARVIRMDVDTTRKKGAHERLLSKFARKEADILLGTQMIAKGLDFENVTLVGVLAADAMLHLPDFRSSEKTFQLLTQVSGRAGRHELEGEVIVQTYTPEHYSIELSSKYDYEKFYNHEMGMRRAFQYPPYVYLVLITVSNQDQMKAIQATQKIAQMLMKHVKENTVILGPTPSSIARINDRYRFQCMIKYRDEPELRKLIRKIIEQFSTEIRKEGLLISVDMQPYNLM